MGHGIGQMRRLLSLGERRKLLKWVGVAAPATTGFSALGL